MKTEFYVGQQVKDCIRCPDKIGVVRSIDRKPFYQISVVWPGRPGAEAYTRDGRWQETHTPTLVPVEDTWEIIHKPVTFEKWERVLVRNFHKAAWEARVYYEHNDAYELPHITGRNGGIGWKYCRKWDENLVGKVTES